MSKTLETISPTDMEGLTQLAHTRDFRSWRRQVDPMSRAVGPVVNVGGSTQGKRLLTGYAYEVIEAAEAQGYVYPGNLWPATWAANWPKTKQAIKQDKHLQDVFWGAVDYLVGAK